MLESSSVATSSRVTLDALDNADKRVSFDLPTAQSSASGINGRNTSPSPSKASDHPAADTASSHGSPALLEGNDDDEDDDFEAYERERLRRIEDNKQLISMLGISSIAPSAKPNDNSARSTPPKTRKKRQQRVYDRSGYIISLPLPGERHRMACVEIPPDRQVYRRIDEGQYVDCSQWAEGEERRWQFGDGQGTLRDGEEAEIGGVSDRFRWRTWKDVLADKEKEQSPKAKSAKGVRFEEGVRDNEEVDLGPPCHQCRRKSDKEKMQCRNVNPLCRRLFCVTCCKRYSYFEFDTESRSFICPVCSDCCNCSRCIRSRKLGYLMVGSARTGLPKQTEGMTIEAWLQETVRAQVAAPFDRVRLVDQCSDVISPDLPPEIEPEREKKTLKRKRSSTAKEGKPPKAPKDPNPHKRTKKAKAKPANVDVDVDAQTESDVHLRSATTSESKSIKLKLKAPTEAASESRPLVIRFKMPPKFPREKEYDSDGDTVGGYSDLDMENGLLSSTTSSLTSLSGSDSARSSSPLKTSRHDLAFDSQPSIPETNTFLAAITGWVHPANGPEAYSSPVMSMPSSPEKDDKATTPPESDGQSRRKKKPPPQANIVRAPKHSLLDPPYPPLPNTVAVEPIVSQCDALAAGDHSVTPEVLPKYTPVYQSQSRLPTTLSAPMTIGPNLSTDLNGHSASSGYPLPYDVTMPVSTDIASAPMDISPPVPESKLKGASGASLSEWLVDPATMDDGERIGEANLVQ